MKERRSETIARDETQSLRGGPTNPSLLLRTKHKGIEIEGHFTHAAYDCFQIEIDRPYSNIRDGYFHDEGGIPQKNWYVKDSKITRHCLRQANKLLLGLYRAAFLFEHERQSVQKVLLDAIEQGSEYISNTFDPERVIDEAFGINLRSQTPRAIEPDEIAGFEDPRSYEEQRDEFILNRISYQLFFKYEVRTSRAPLAQLVHQHFGVSLLCSDALQEGTPGDLAKEKTKHE